MKNMKKFLALALVIVSVLAIAAPALAYQKGVNEYLGDRAFKFGATGPRVRNLQIMLNTLGMNAGAVDSKFGDNTDAAVRRFQKRYGLKEDGIVGDDTKATIWMALGEQAPEGCRKLPTP